MAVEPKKTTTKKTTTTKPKTTTKKASPGTAKKPTNTTKKKTTSSSKTTPKSSASTKKTTSPKTSKTTSKDVKNVKNQSNLSSGEVKTTKTVKKPTTKPGPKTTKKPKVEGRIKKVEELTTLEALEASVDGTQIIEKKPLGKAFYLLFSIVFYAIAFFYINTVVYDGTDILQSAVFAFAALFIVFVLMLFNIHVLVFNFFTLPFRRLLKQARRETHQEIFFTVGKNKIQTTFNKYRSLFTLILYGLFAGLLTYASIAESLLGGESVLDIIFSVLISLLIYLVLICSWQYLFNIIPSILDKSIDAKNGYVLTLSAAVIVIYVMFIIFEISYLSEIMIFVLIIGFIALLGVNLNMIVGEINIFQNLRGRKSKAVTRVVFTIFFGFHIYVIIYASVVAYSIYNWEPQSFVFSSNPVEYILETDLYDETGNPIDEVYYSHYNDVDMAWEFHIVNDIYDSVGNVITVYYDDEYNPPQDKYGVLNDYIQVYRKSDGQAIMNAETSEGLVCDTDEFFYDGSLACFRIEAIPHEYSDFLYWTVVTVSTIGYGDIHPSSEYNVAMGWGAFLGMYGLTFFALSISFVSNIAMEGVEKNRKEN